MWLRSSWVHTPGHPLSHGSWDGHQWQEVTPPPEVLVSRSGVNGVLGALWMFSGPLGRPCLHALSNDIPPGEEKFSEPWRREGQGTGAPSHHHVFAHSGGKGQWGRSVRAPNAYWSLCTGSDAHTPDGHSVPRPTLSRGNDLGAKRVCKSVV